jgi:pimeloyl-ACP methyl ester carboxylesterase
VGRGGTGAAPIGRPYTPAVPEPTSHSYMSQRLRLNYLDWGNPSAPPLVLLHGSRDHAHNWDWVARRLHDRFHVIAPDFRGHGDSDWSVGARYSPAEHVYDVAQLIHQQDLGPVRMIAHSLGGLVALRYAGTFPEQVARLVVVDGTGDISQFAGGRPSAPARMRTWVETQRGLAGRRPRLYATLEEAYERMQEANPHLTADQARHLTIHGAKQNEDGTYSWKFDNYVHGGHMVDLAPDEIDQIWANIDCPVLFLTGRESFQVDTFDERDLVGRFRDARHAWVDDAGHWLHHDQLETFLELTTAFLDDEEDQAPA